MVVKQVTIKLHRGTTAEWTADDPVLALGEPAYDTTTGYVYIGDGVSKWSELTAIQPGAAGGGGSGTVTTSGSPVDNDFAKFTSATAIEGRSYAEVRSDLNVEDGATADQTGAEIKTAYEGEADTNAYTDAEKSKLSGISEGAKVGDVVGPDSATDNAIVRFNTTTGKLIQNSDVTIDDDGNISGVGSSGGVESTGSVILTADSDGTPRTVTLNIDGSLEVPGTVDGIDIATDVAANTAKVSCTTANVTSAGAVMDSEVSSLSGIKTLTVPDSTTISTFGASLVDDANAGVARTTLGAGTMSDLSDDDSPTLGGNLDGDGNTISNYLNTYNNQTGTTYTFVAGDRGKIVTFNNDASITVTVPDSLTAGWTVTCIQLGAGQVTFSASGSMNIRNRQSHTKMHSQYAMVTLAVYASNNATLGGDTAA